LNAETLDEKVETFLKFSKIFDNKAVIEDLKFSLVDYARILMVSDLQELPTDDDAAGISDSADPSTKNGYLYFQILRIKSLMDFIANRFGNRFFG